MSRFNQFLCLIFVVNIAFADVIPFKDCGSTGTDITLNVANCSKAPCIFVKNTNASITIEFTSSRLNLSYLKEIFNNCLYKGSESKTLRNLVFGIIAGVKVPFPIPQEDACKVGLPCPLPANVHVKEELYLAILPEYPSISLFGQIQINNENDQTVVCILLPMKIQ